MRLNKASLQLAELVPKYKYSLKIISLPNASTMFYTTKTSNSLPASRQRGVLERFCFCSTQSYNRYSYVLNNPLKYTDPSGWILKAAPEKDISVDTHSGGGGGNIGYIGNLNSITGMGSFGYNYMGPYSAYASNPGGYAATYGTTANWVTSVHQSSNGTMPNWYKGNSSTMYHIAKQTIIDINTFNASTHSNTIIPRTGNYEYSGINWNTATACENCGVPNTPTRSNAGNANSGGGGEDATSTFFKNVNTSLGAFGVGNGAKGELINYASKSNPEINNLKYVKGMKVLSKRLFVTQALLSGYQTYNAFKTGNSNAWGVAEKAGLDVTIGYISLVGGFAGWGVGAIYFIGDAAGWWGNWGQPTPSSPFIINKK